MEMSRLSVEFIHSKIPYRMEQKFSGCYAQGSVKNKNRSQRENSRNQARVSRPDPADALKLIQAGDSSQIGCAFREPGVCTTRHQKRLNGGISCLTSSCPTSAKILGIVMEWRCICFYAFLGERKICCSRFLRCSNIYVGIGMYRPNEPPYWK